MTTDGNTHAINQHLNDREDWDALQEVTAALEQAEALIEVLEAELEIALEGLKKSQQEIDDYIRQDYPQDIPLHERYRMRDFSANPARTALAELTKERSDEKGEKE